MVEAGAEDIHHALLVPQQTLRESTLLEAKSTL